ncbi:MAG: right-handed parallel beta-helix repeat-containing protein, partial [Candidatus Zixiibacteriota bacterium]
MLAGKPRRHSFFLICVSFAFLAVPIAGAATITVCGDGSGDYLTIQEGIDAAVAGDEVVICPGIYTGNGNRDLDYNGKAITVRGTDPEDRDVVAATIIDCQGSEAEPHRGFKFHSSETADSVLAGLTITNGYGPEEYVDYYPLSRGGAILCIGSSPSVENCVLGNNSSGDYGGGMYNGQDSNPTLTNCTFSGNCASAPYWYSGKRGGGMYNISSNPTLTNCTFSENTAGRHGGGMCNLYSSPTLTNCMFSSNGATDYDGGGMCN